jgi:hypothetical protein
MTRVNGSIIERARPAIMGTALRCSGVVSSVEEVTPESRRLTFEIVIESPPGRQVTTGSAVAAVALS